MVTLPALTQLTPSGPRLLGGFILDMPAEGLIRARRRYKARKVGKVIVVGMHAPCWSPWIARSERNNANVRLSFNMVRMV
jgi:hypothetical protein